MIIFRREMAGYFATPLAYVFIVIFLALSGALTFFAGGFFESEQASLRSFFNFHSWLYLILIPALSMRLWGGGTPQRYDRIADDSAGDLGPGGNG